LRRIAGATFGTDSGQFHPALTTKAKGIGILGVAL